MPRHKTLLVTVNKLAPYKDNTDLLKYTSSKQAKKENRIWDKVQTRLLCEVKVLLQPWPRNCQPLVLSPGMSRPVLWVTTKAFSAAGQEPRDIRRHHSHAPLTTTVMQHSTNNPRSLIRHIHEENYGVFLGLCLQRAFSSHHCTPQSACLEPVALDATGSEIRDTHFQWLLSEFSISKFGKLLIYAWLCFWPKYLLAGKALFKYDISCMEREGGCR